MDETRDANRPYDRRSALKIAAGAGASAALLGAAGPAVAQGAAATAAPAAPGATAPAERTGTPGWHRFTIGEARVTTVLDGLRPGEGPFPTFGADQSQEAMGALMKANFLPEDRFVNGFTPVLIETGDDLVLVDTGFGEGGAKNGLGRLVERMGAAGYAPSDVTVVVLTHFHGDHIQGLVAGGRPTFENARYVAGAREYEWWTSDEAKAGERKDGAALVEKLVVPLREKMTLVKEGDTVVPGLTALEAFGHSPGMMVFRLESGGKALWLTADTANHFVASLQKPDWQVRFDQDKAMASETRRKVFDRIAQEKAPFIGFHMPFPAVGFVEKMEDGGYRYVAASYQFDIDGDA
ncbi:MBL fold metallo-hydrolase [Aurantimonas sp. Leaf443]|uniref:MBL fold metallo-hydrolase n=1 Tax=Aurantimonas sp. Leaf443 TaxID=1736378 RepID=UPI0006FE9953|nr:MBL fold metallo-hydrolase [Aurantimonas sp. Leaf443]KQT83814.1 MBL fold metallo-hydrolase [Aurantimonas sp. Leaf443]